MAFIYDYIRQLDVCNLRAGEVSQCLLYIDHMSKSDPEIERSNGDIIEKLQDRLTILRKEKKTG
ncbi:hypothetical protein DXT99_22185 [Pontibacter diazotrophicus]|uniref:Uncharacterized protein n=1 Tax=Pontibacter diazotrophicus TaxID=1400979 RepID=A0A3D8L6F6_9BACT|nr:hypothetical protein [Pontibacter diazotrophicus]RDV12978.1 hypothetical protein DXT99_22185 [Pontibacter diazotrophicus]